AYYLIKANAEDIYTPPPSGATCSARTANPPHGNPIYPVAGNKRQPEPLGVSLEGVSIGLSYDSLAAPWSSGVFSAQPGETPAWGDAGKLWASSVARRLVLSPNGISLQARRGSGEVISFAKSGSVWSANPDQMDSLTVPSAGGFLYRDQSALALESYDASGLLQSLTSISGMKLTAVQSGGNLQSLTDPFGRVVSFTYKALASGDMGLSTVVDPLGQTYTLGYDSNTANSNLTSITWPDGTIKTFVYDSANPNQIWALTGVLDENNKRFATFAYDAAGWAKSTEHAGGVDKYSVNYTNAPQPRIRELYDSTSQVVTRYHEWQVPTGAQVTLPNNSVINLGVTAVLGDPTLTGQGSPRSTGTSQPAGSGCGASSSSLDYDAQGNLKRKDDFAGKRVCMHYDAANRMDARMEGLNGGSSGNDCDAALGTSDFSSLPAETRKISTAWHPDWAVKVKQAAPNRLTTWVYNGQPDPFNSNQTASCAPTDALLPDGKPIVVLCKEVEQATTDANGSQGLSPTLDNADNTVAWQRSTSYTYNQYGQVLTRTDALGNVTTYLYYDSPSFTGTAPNEVGHTKGDLMSVTNAKSQVSNYTAYDRAGRLLSMTDPNGTVSTWSYWPRGWIKSVSVAGMSTSYDYWPTGLLKKVSQPDGTALYYSYDDAHRLTDISDQLDAGGLPAGNKVHYVLDNAGNRTQEQISDASGTLRRQIDRTYDALNRLWTVKGAAQ
ncbi:MAG: RHS repeat protein, partial [Burkholderiales bacterium]|nr:RHS repeat protein [Burkholderiales bacterium]